MGLAWRLGLVAARLVVGLVAPGMVAPGLVASRLVELEELAGDSCGLCSTARLCTWAGASSRSGAGLHLHVPLTV